MTDDLCVSCLHYRLNAILVNSYTFNFYKLTLIYGKQYQLTSPDSRWYWNFSACAAGCLHPLNVQRPAVRFSLLEDHLCFRSFVLQKYLGTAIIFMSHVRMSFRPASKVLEFLDTLVCIDPVAEIWSEVWISASFCTFSLPVSAGNI